MPVVEPSGESEPAAIPEETRRERLYRTADVNRVPARAIIFTVAVVAGVYLFAQVVYHMRTILLIALLAGFIALILNPIVVALENWKVKRRGAAVALVTILALLVFLGLAAVFGYPLVDGITHFAQALPKYVHTAEQGKGWVGHLIAKYHVQAWVTRNTAKLTSLASTLGKPALAIGKGAASALLTLFGIFAFVVLLLIEAPKMRRSIIALLAPERAERFTLIGSKVGRAVSGYIVGDLVTSLVAGVVVFITLMIMGVPYALLFALWVALVDFLPTIGGALAGIPTILFAFAHSLSAGVVTAVVFLAYTQLENHVLNPIVMSKTVKINPLLVFVSVMVGADIGAWLGGLFGGFVAVLLAVPIAGSLQVVVQEYWRVSSAAAIADAEGPQP